jgi:Mrp family chromosome partitioning ATPase
MSTTNRAFIKAYRHDAAQSEPVAEPAIVAEQRSAARVSSVGAASQRAAHVNTQRPVADRRPLSSFIARPQISETVTESDHEKVLQPGTTVASFHWPAVCRTLVQQSGQQLDHVIRVMFARAGGGNSLIGVLGMFPRIGTTTTALCLASRAAGRGRRVILGDCNFRTPRIASLVEAVPTAGWEDVLRHSATLADATIRATNDQLDVLAMVARPLKDPEGLAGGLQAAVTAGVLRHEYDLAILDLGSFFDPVSQPTLLALVANMGVDAVVAIAGPEPADPRDIETVVEHLGNRGCELLGVIENRVAKPKAA